MLGTVVGVSALTFAALSVWFSISYGLRLLARARFYDRLFEIRNTVIDEIGAKKLPNDPAVIGLLESLEARLRSIKVLTLGNLFAVHRAVQRTGYTYDSVQALVKPPPTNNLSPSERKRLFELQRSATAAIVKYVLSSSVSALAIRYCAGPFVRVLRPMATTRDRGQAAPTTNSAHLRARESRQVIKRELAKDADLAVAMGHIEWDR